MGGLQKAYFQSASDYILDISKLIIPLSEKENNQIIIIINESEKLGRINNLLKAHNYIPYETLINQNNNYVNNSIQQNNNNVVEFKLRLSIEGLLLL